MYKIVFARHAQSIANVERWISGWTDVELTDYGISQAQSLGKRLKDYPFEQIFCSDLKRSLVTAEIVGKELSVPVHSDPGLRERNYGVFTGLKYRETDSRFAEETARLRNDLSYIPEGGESLGQHLERVVDSVVKRVKLVREKELLFISHRGSIRVLMQWLYGSKFAQSVSLPDPPGFIEILWDDTGKKSSFKYTMIT